MSNSKSNSFDIRSLLQFNHADFFCKNCYALLNNVEFYGPQESQKIDYVRCPVCKVRYLPTEAYPLYNSYSAKADFYNYITRPPNNLGLEFSDLIGHSRELADTVVKAQQFLDYNGDDGNRPGNPPLRTLLILLKQARKFVHFITYGSISHQLIGALKLVALDVPVRGVVSKVGAGESTITEMTEHAEDTSKLRVKVYESKSGDRYNRDVPHNKLVVIDGLVALKGSANLTLSAYRKAAKGYELLEFVTDTEQIIELNNRHFSTIYGKLSNKEDIEMYDFEGIPF